ncbi:MAG TPA: dihydropteroate synthase [Verrucomicrobia bacterium]|nr:dihydropteroate synthase [Verrucomicrobiales bacterium]HIL54855.1 dihydropteroate synthase [Verrucomicrobiota bacterium]
MQLYPASSNAPEKPDPWSIRGKSYDLSKRGIIMGIINTTPDSFSDGGLFESSEAAIQRAIELENEGASIIDFGGESTRPGAEKVSVKEELNRILPVVEKFVEIRSPKTLISIDTSKAEVAEAGLAAGADIINDVTGFSDPAMRKVAAESKCGIVIMHMAGNPRTMQISPNYSNVTAEVITFLNEQIALCESEGISRERIIVDPGIGFGKSLEHNLELIRSIPQITKIKRPLLIGASRKTFIGKILENDDINEREWPTVALTSYCREQGATLFRVHSVKQNLDAMLMTEAIIN